MRLWGGRFKAETDPLVADFTSSVEFDRALAPDDLAGSVAHVHGLQRAGLLTDADAASTCRWSMVAHRSVSWRAARNLACRACARARSNACR